MGDTSEKPHLNIVKCYRDAPRQRHIPRDGHPWGVTHGNTSFYEQAVSTLEKPPVFSLEQHSLSTNTWKSTVVKSLDATMEKLKCIPKNASEVDYLTSNSCRISTNDEHRTLTVSYPLTLWMILMVDKDRQSYEEKDICQDVWYLRFLKPHIKRLLGYEAVSYFEKHVQCVCEAERGLGCFASKSRAPPPLPWKIDNRPTMYSFHTYVDQKKMSEPPVVVYK